MILPTSSRVVGFDGYVTPPRRARAIRTIAYWTFTLIVAAELLAGSIWDLLRIEYVRVVFGHLGYPLYLLWILGTWKLPGGVVLLVPRFPRLKEWAYAGAFFSYSGAGVSHLLVGDGPRWWWSVLGLAALTLASWALRPPDRRLGGSPDSETRPAAWIAPLVFAGVILVVAVLTLPKAAPSF